jgi:hypothetical protein
MLGMVGSPPIVATETVARGVSVRALMSFRQRPESSHAVALADLEGGLSTAGSMRAGSRVTITSSTVGRVRSGRAAGRELVGTLHVDAKAGTWHRAELVGRKSLAGGLSSSSPPFAGGEGRVRGAMPGSVLCGPLTPPSRPASGGRVRRDAATRFYGPTR